MIFNMGIAAPFQVTCIYEADGRLVNVEIPTYIDVVALPEETVIVSPLKRSDWCITTYPSFH